MTENYRKMGVERVLREVGPHRLRGPVVAGFKRGSRELGWPTANLDPSAFETRLDASEEGVYIGWARIVDRDLSKASQQVHKAVVRFHLTMCFRAHEWSRSSPPDAIRAVCSCRSDGIRSTRMSSGRLKPTYAMSSSATSTVRRCGC